MNNNTKIIYFFKENLAFTSRVNTISMTKFIRKLFYWVHINGNFVLCTKLVYIIYIILGDVSIYVVDNNQYDELGCEYFITFL